MREHLPKTVVNLTANAPEIAADTISMLDGLDRLRSVEHWRFTSAPDVLDEIDIGLTALENALLAYQEDPGEVALASFEAARELITTTLTKTPVPIITTGHLSGIRAATADLEAAAVSAIGQVQSSASDASSASSAMIGKLGDQHEDIAREIGTLRAEVAQLSAEGIAISTGIQSVQATQATEFAEMLKSARTKLDAEVAERSSRGKDEIVKFRAEASEAVQGLTEMQDQGRGLLGAVSRATISYNYGAYARGQSIAAIAWTLLSVATALWSLWFVWHETSDGRVTPDGWTLLGIRSLLTALVVLVSGYLATIATRHRENARVAKEAQLDLNALEPYLTNLDEAAAKDLRTKFASSHFLRRDSQAQPRRGLIVFNRQAEKK